MMHTFKCKFQIILKNQRARPFRNRSEKAQHVDFKGFDTISIYVGEESAPIKTSMFSKREA